MQLTPENFQEVMISHYETFINLSSSNSFDRFVEYLKMKPCSEDGDPYTPEELNALKETCEISIEDLQNLKSRIKGSYRTKWKGKYSWHIPSFAYPRMRGGKDFA